MRGAAFCGELGLGLVPVLREPAFACMIDRGLNDVDQGRTVSHEEVRREVESWGK